MNNKKEKKLEDQGFTLLYDELDEATERYAKSIRELEKLIEVSRKEFYKTYLKSITERRHKQKWYQDKIF